MASISGLSLAEGSSKRNESLAVLQSEALTERYIEKNDLLPILFSERWDAAKGGWTATSPDEVPTLWKGNVYFKKKVRSLTSDSKTGLVTLQITWTDPKLAAQWANDLVRETNSHLKGVAITEAERNIAYLREQRAKSDLVSAREAIASILRNEINNEMLARGSDQYALKIIDPAVPPEQPEWPKKMPWIATGFFLGLLASSFGAILRKALQ
jgi:capsular polysaccharide biosynthesis protein